MVIVAPAPHPERPHVAAVGGALARLAAAFPPPNTEPIVDDQIGLHTVPIGGLRVNVIVPSRPASDPRHDAALVHAVRMMGSEAGTGIRGSETFVTLPAPPAVAEALLPEVQAALDDGPQPHDGDDWASWREDPVADDKLDEASLQRAADDLQGLLGLQETTGSGWRS